MNLSNLLVIICAIGFASGDSHKRMLPYDRSSIDDCEIRFYKQYRLMGVLPAGGRPVQLREFAHIAAIGWSGAGARTRWLCAGSLIWENFILTAAHCAADDNNVPPDVARLGDININSDDDDQFVQELKIVDIIRHPKHRFSSTYHDIALLKLENNVVVTDTVVPTCLWLDDEIRFPKLLAAGWGRTGIGENQTDILLKVELAPMSNENCSTYYVRGTRTLRHGLMEHQLCAGDERMDTCPGDSGGPLHVKLFEGWKLTPFLVGVTSFGTECGISVPGVYVKVASFGDWIIETLQRHGEPANRFQFEPLVCAERYLSLREYKPDLVIVHHGTESPNWSNKYISLGGSDYIVHLRWPYPASTVLKNCVGALIEPGVVLTLAECILREESWPSYVVLTDSSEIEIEDIVVHPQYNSTLNPFYNNIAVVKLKTFAWIEPYCAWYGDHNLHREILLSAQNLIPTERTNESSNTPIMARVWKESVDHCPLAQRYAETLSRGLQDEHLCYGNQPFLVPGVCETLPGSPIETNDGVYVYIEGINLFGRDCGYGEPGVGVRLGAHKAWLETVLLPRSKHDALVFIDPDLEMSDECLYADGTQGTCTPQQDCPAFFVRQQNKQQLTFCMNSTVVCCPKTVPKQQYIEIENEFNQCEERYAQLRTIRQDEMWPHLVKLSRQNGTKFSFRCYGYMISARGIVSSASCLWNNRSAPNVAHLGDFGTAKNATRIRIEKIEIHPEYSSTSPHQHNIAIVKLESAVEPSEHAFPGCLWQNVTHSPVREEIYNIGSTKYDLIYPMYKSDCEAILNSSFDEPEMICMNPGLRDYEQYSTHFDLQIRHQRSHSSRTRCYNAGSPIVWKDFHDSIDDDLYTEYLVNMYSHGSCNVTTPRIVTRVAPYVEWFMQVLQ